ncbi:carboxypeptidase-like regulatory domain-containing protein [bacterium]|nr:carboxypeptidase-like regulatory domain-containing protein [bacterium]
MRTIPCAGLTLAVVVALMGAGPALAVPLTFSGTVVDAAGHPIADAQVAAVVVALPNSTALTVFKTDAAGAFTFQSEPLPYDQRNARRPVLAYKAGLAMALGSAEAGKPLVLTLGDKPEQRSGLVLGPDGKPLAGVPVRATSVSQTDSGGANALSSSSLPSSEGQTVTDAQGRFDLPGFAPGISVFVSMEAEGCAGAGVRITDTTPMTIALKPEATVSGKVLVNGQPQAGVRVWSYPTQPMAGARSASAQTAADGTYTLHHLGAGVLSVSVSGAPGMARPLEQIVTIKAGQAEKGVDFTLTPGALIRGKVTDEKTGQPVAKASVTTMTAEGRSPASASTDADGKYELRVPPGTYRLVCQGVGGAWTGPVFVTVGGRPQPVGSVEVTVKEGDALEGQNLTTRLPRTIKGQVLLPDGQPATGALLTMLGGFEGRAMPDLQPEARFELKLPDPPTTPGPLSYQSQPTLLVTEPTRNLAAAIQSPFADSLTVALQPAATVSVLIADEQNHPLPGFRVSVSYPMGEHSWMSQGSVVSDALGLVRLALLPPGFKLRVTPDTTLQQLMVNDTALREAEFVLKPGEERQLPTIIVNPAGRSLNVFVGEADGKPVAGAQVYAPGAQTPALTDAAGKVTLTKLPLKGKVLLIAFHPTEERLAVESVDPDAGVWPGLIVKPRGTTTGMLIAKPGGKPLEGWQVWCWARGDIWRLPYEVQQRLGTSGGERPRSTTDAQGRWRLEGLIPGLEYQLVGSTDAAGGARWGGRGISTFTAAGGPDQQDLGIVECDVPEGQ